MKQIQIALLLAVAGFSALSGKAQTTETSVMIDKENRHAVMMPVDQPEKETREALRLRLKQSGLQERMSGNVARYKGVVLSEISQEKVDIYTKVVPGPNNTSVVYMAVSRGYNNFTNSQSDSGLNGHVKAFLQSFIGDANKHSGSIDITKQVDDIRKEEDSYQQLVNEQADLQKKRSAIDTRLLDIQNALVLKKDLIDGKKLALDNAKTKQTKL
ncbi:hypothetical protein [Paraflavitalea pollutisoli]|uniref:hypothetical protein n=1 Tax=Paraflavitalea pollutisoli TaxID=3034143 RepID=UPI0023EBAFC7|nr:hypothetical protein [Paraflavitalea sp. H1-2-19X]